MTVNVVSSSQALGGVGDVVAQKGDRFEELVLALKDALGPSSGLTSDDVDVGFLMELMRDYDGNDMKWSKYAFGDGSRGYTRNLVDEGNGKSNLVGHVSKPRPGASNVLTRSQLACTRLVPRKGQPHPRPRKRALRHEDSARRSH